jgi:hypothetical protein
MAKVDIGADTYDSFAGEDFADTYIAADPIAAPDWAALDQDGRNRLSVTATRVLKRLAWKDGVPSFDDTPLAVQEATCEFAAAILGGYDLQTAPGSVLQVRRQKAGSVEVEYFGNFDSPAYRPPPLPQAVWDLIKSMIHAPAEGIGLPGSISSGTCGDSVSDDMAGGRRDQRWVGFGPTSRDYT